MPDTIDTSGFYRTETGEDSSVELFFAPNFVYGPDYTLLREYHDSMYDYPVHGWIWFNNVQSARAYFGIPEPEEL